MVGCAAPSGSARRGRRMVRATTVTDVETWPHRLPTKREARDSGVVQVDLEQGHVNENHLKEKLDESLAALAATRIALAHEQQLTEQLREDKRQRRQSHAEQNEAEKVASRAACCSSHARCAWCARRVKRADVESLGSLPHGLAYCIVYPCIGEYGSHSSSRLG